MSSKVFGSTLSYFLDTLRRTLSRKTRTFVFIFFFSFLFLIINNSIVGRILDVGLSIPFYAIRGERDQPSDVLLVTIDDVSYESAGLQFKNTFPRKIIGESLQRIQNLSPRLTILDLFLKNDPENLSSQELIRNAIASRPTVIGQGVVELPEAEKVSVDTGLLWIKSDPEFEAAARYHVPFLMRFEFGLAWWLTLDRDSSRPLKELVPLAEPLREIGGYQFPTPSSASVINFYGAPGRFNYLSLAEFYTEESAAKHIDKVKDKVVVIGSRTSLAQRGQGFEKDEFAVPSSIKKGMFGAEVHSTIVANLIDQSWLKPIPPKISNKLQFVVVILCLFFATKLTPRKRTLLLLSIGILWILISYICFAYFYYQVSGALLFLIFSYYIRTRLAEEREGWLDKSISWVESMIGTKVT